MLGSTRCASARRTGNRKDCIMATVSEPPVPAVLSHNVNGDRTLQGVTNPERTGAPALPATTEWGNAAPLALSALAVTTFSRSMVSANAVKARVGPVVY